MDRSISIDSSKLFRVGRKQYVKGISSEYPWETGLRKSYEEIWYLFHGEGSVRIDRGKWTSIRSGNLVWFPAEVFCEFRQNPEHPVGVNFFHFTADSRCGFPEVAQNNCILDVTDPSFIESLSRRIVELYWEVYHDRVVLGGEPPDSQRLPCPQFVRESDCVRKDLFLPQTMHLTVPRRTGCEVTKLAHSLFVSLVGEYLHLASKNDFIQDLGLQKFHRRLVDEMVAEIQERCSGTGVTIAELAESRGYSCDHLGRIFRKVMGCGIQTFLIKARVAKARQLLLESNLSVKEIAAKLGYSSPFYFSRQFKELCGLAPLAFREKHGPKGRQ